MIVMIWNPFKIAPKGFLGIDIGTSAIKIVEMSRAGKRRKLDNYGEMKAEALYEKPFRTFEKSTLSFSNRDVVRSLSAVLKEAFTKISWVGFYLLKNNKLHLGPFQGKVACTTIAVGSGVCGASVQLGETIIVDDVDSFPGHIACDSNSKSEIVVPLMV